MPARNAPSASDSPASSVSAASPSVDQQQVQHEQLGRALPRDDVEPPAHRPLAEAEHDDQRDRRLHGRERRAPTASVVAARRQRRDHDQERDDREVLEQQDRRSRRARAASRARRARRASSTRSPSSSSRARRRAPGRPASRSPATVQRRHARAPVVIATCASPSPNTARRIAVSFGRLNSRPSENIRNTMPNSAR